MRGKHWEYIRVYGPRDSFTQGLPVMGIAHGRFCLTKIGHIVRIIWSEQCRSGRRIAGPD